MGVVFFVERNMHGSRVVYGVDGVKQYYGLSKAEAVQRYKENCNVFINQNMKMGSREEAVRN